MQGYLSISEFAKICGVSRDTLLYYDKINLLKPAYKASNSYRYYSFFQYENYILINSFKQVGIPLNTIKDLMKNKTPESLYKLLTDTETNLTNKINNLKFHLNILKNDREELKIAIENINKLIVTSLIEIPIIRIEQKISGEKAIIKSIIERNNFLKLNNLITSNNIGFYGNLDNIVYDKNNAIISFDGTYSTLLDNRETGSNNFLNGKFIVTYVFTDFTNEKELIDKVKNYANKNKIELNNLYFTESIIGEFFSESQPLILTKYLFQIKE